MANKILLADDSITIQKVVNLTFTDEGINVVTVGNGELALKKLGEEQFDLVLADIFMPGRNGYEVCEHVKASPQTRDVPVILLVGAFEPFDKSEAARVRADGHLTKPFESRILIETVKRMLAEAAVRQAAAAPPPAAEPAYKGQVVGWDVPTTPMMPQHLEEDEPEPPSYDPYASTAKLPPIHVAEERGPFEPAQSEHTMNFGAPAPSSGMFTPGGVEPPADLFEIPQPEPHPETAAPHVRAIPGPPDSVAGFSFTADDDTGSSAAVETSAGDRPSISYQQIPQTDSPLDLPDLTVVDQHTYEPTTADERRDPLLETFADVAESTAQLGAPADPGLEVNAHEDAAPSMSVGATEGIISAWDPQAQPEAAEPQAEPEVVAAEEESAAVWQTQPFAVDAPFASADEAEPVAEVGFAVAESTSPFGVSAAPLPSDDRPPSKPTIGLADLGGLGSLRGGNATERLTQEEFESLTAEHAATAEAAPDVAEPAPSWEPEVESAAVVDEAADAPVEEASQPEAAVEAELHVEAEYEPVEVETPAEPLVEAASEPEPATEPAAEAAVEATPEAIEASPTQAEAPQGEAAEPEVVEEAAAASAEPVNGSGAAHVPAEILDEVVRRTLERMNDDVIREIAWEVVPQIAESLIRKRLAEGQ